MTNTAFEDPEWMPNTAEKQLMVYSHVIGLLLSKSGPVRFEADDVEWYAAGDMVPYIDPSEEGAFTVRLIAREEAINAYKHGGR